MTNTRYATLSLLTMMAGVLYAGRAYAAPSAIKLVQSSADSQLVALPDVAWSQVGTAGIPAVNIYAGTRQQQILGFGGAFTESAATVLNSLGAELRREVLTKLFSPTSGIGYSLTRTHINSNDFSTHHYTYDDVPGDIDLTSFSINDDLDDLIPLIRDASEVPGASFKILASTWSAPAWMKGNDTMIGGGSLLPQYYGTWANYFAKYLRAYGEHGIQIWGITAQNEPLYQPAPYAQKWEGMNYSVDGLTAFIRDYLGPTLERAGFGGVEIFSGDDQKNQVLNFAKSGFSDATASRYISGIAAHWYAGDWFEQLDETSLRYPGKVLLASEATIYPNVNLGLWANATRYVHDIIGDMNYGASGWIDWNIALDDQGGPNPPDVKNPCSAPVIVSGGAYHLNTQYYALGHFSKYVKAGAYKLGNITTGDAHLEASAFENPDGQIVIVVYNGNDSDEQVAIRDAGAVAELSLPAQSITTLAYTNSGRASYPASEVIALRASNGLYVTDPGDGTALSPTSAQVGPAQKLLLSYKPDGYVTLRSVSTSKYLSVGASNQLTATAETASTQIVPNSVNPYTSFERYQLVNNADGTISLMALKNGKYVQDAFGFGALQASGSAIGRWEKFVKIAQTP